MMIVKTFFLIYLGCIFTASVIASDLRRILPINLNVRKGQDLQLRLTKVLPSTESCYVKTPLLVSYNLLSEESNSANRISYWTENGECGVKVRNITEADAGRWRLTAKNGNETLIDAATVLVLDTVNSLEKTFSIESGLKYTLVLEEKTEYCRIQPPHTEEPLLVSGECKVDLFQPSTAADGVWLATAGVIGQVEEVPARIKLNVFRDRLTTGFIAHTDSNIINIYCNIRDTDQEFEFCRFSKPDNAEMGFQLSEGLHSGRYGYYGAGLKKGECGITIEAPMEKDYGQWLCSVGVKDKEPFGSYIQIYNQTGRAVTSRAEISSTSDTTTSLNAKLQLRCKMNVSMSYCWFLGPNKKIYPLTQSEIQDDLPYKYIGEGFGKGDCSIEITAAAAEHQGQWICHMGPKEPGFELTSTINVRVSETSLAAVNSNINITTGETLTLECRTVPEKVSIDYCRFLMPDGNGLHISDNVTEENPLIFANTRYWFTGESTRLGGCGLRIDRVSTNHFGNWTCAARLEIAQITDENTEAFDIIVVHGMVSPAAITEDEANSTTSAMAGIMVGAVASVIVLVAGFVFLIKWVKIKLQDQGNVRVTGRVSEVTLQSITDSSTSSDSDMRLGDLSGMNIGRR